MTCCPDVLCSINDEQLSGCEGREDSVSSAHNTCTSWWCERAACEEAS